jgi:hypothetical protein
MRLLNWLRIAAIENKIAHVLLDFSGKMERCYR